MPLSRLRRFAVRMLAAVTLLQNFVFAVPLARAATFIPVGVDPRHVAITADGAKVYVPNLGTGSASTVSVISTATDTVTANIPVGIYPGYVTITPDGTKAYVNNLGASTVSVIDTATDTVTATVPVGSSPELVSVTPDGAKAYVANANDATVSVIDTATDTVTATVPVGVTPISIAFTLDGAKAYVTNQSDATVSVIDTATDTVTATVPVGTFPQNVAITPDGTKAYVTNLFGSTVSVISTATDTVTATIPVGTWAFFVGFTPDGTKAYVTNLTGNTVSVISTATDTVTATIPVGAWPTSVAFTPDGLKAYVTSYDGGSVSIIDTLTNTVTATLPYGVNPAFVVITPDGTKAYVANGSGNDVSVIGTDEPTPSNTTRNSVVLSREAINANAVATISFSLADNISTQLSVTFDPAFTGMNVSGASALTPNAPGCISNFVATGANSFTADKASCTGPVVISGVQVVNPPTPGPYLVSWVNDDPGYAMVAIVDDDQVTVNAQVAPSITFDLDTGTAAGETAAPYNVALGSLSTGAVNHSDNAGINSIFAQLDTNATSGAQVTVLSANAALASASVPADTIPNGAATMGAGTANYGICVENVTGPASASGTFEAASPYNTGICDPAGDTNDVQALDTVTPTPILDSNSAPVTSGSAEILVNAAIDTSTPAHNDYTDVLTFVATGTF